MDEFMLQKGMEVNGVPPTNGGNDKDDKVPKCFQLPLRCDSWTQFQALPFNFCNRNFSKFIRFELLFFATAWRQVPVTLLTGFLGAGKTVRRLKFSKESHHGMDGFLKHWSQWTDPKAFRSFWMLSVLGTLNSNLLFFLFSSWQFFTCPRHDSTLHWKKARVGSGCPSTVEIVVHLSSGQGASHPTYLGIEPGWTWRKIDKNSYQSVVFSGLKEFWRRGIIGTTCDTRTLQIAVIENEIGALGVDGALVANAHSEAGCPKKHLGLDSLSFFENARLMMVS